MVVSTDTFTRMRCRQTWVFLLVLLMGFFTSSIFDNFYTWKLFTGLLLFTRKNVSYDNFYTWKLFTFYSLAKIFILITSIPENLSLLFLSHGFIFYHLRNEVQHDLVWRFLMIQCGLFCYMRADGRITGLTTCWFWYVNITQMTSFCLHNPMSILVNI